MTSNILKDGNVKEYILFSTDHIAMVLSSRSRYNVTNNCYNEFSADPMMC